MVPVAHRSLSSSSYLPISSTNTTVNRINDESEITYSINMAKTNTSTNKTVTFIKQNYFALCMCLILYSIIAGYIAGIQPTNQFRYFSYHPLLMTCGMIGSMSIGAITKKIGGYMNTKVSCFFRNCLFIYRRGCVLFLSPREINFACSRRQKLT